MYRIHWKRVLLLSVLAGVLALILRGFLIARCSPQEKQSKRTVGGQQIAVYDKERNEAVVQPLESYLIGVVAAEMPASFELEALKAQAVAARTYTLYKASHGGCHSYEEADVCTGSGCCQAYRSLQALRERWGSAYEDNLKKITKAVEETTGEIAMYEGEPIEALYHASSGGSTEDSEAVYKSVVPYLRAVSSTNESGASRLSGREAIPLDSFCHRVNARFSNAGLNMNELETQLAILETTDSGRVRSVRLGGATASGRDMRQLFGLDSTLFTMEITDENVVFHTKGFGHGVGMSQTGANGMALGGKTYQEILTYYYTGVTIMKAR